MKRTLSTTKVATLLGVSVGSVKNWIDKGHLKAGRTPGGHRHVAAGDLRAFLERQGLPVPPELQPASSKVLIVDGDPDFRRWTAEVVGQARPGLEVYQANDGYDAGGLVSRERPNVVLLDLRMSTIDGYDVCRRIKADRETQEAVVIATAEDWNDDARQRILGCGAKACLTKPISAEMLVGILDEALDGAG
jgi:two-component system, OmpR family, response regulator